MDWLPGPAYSMVRWFGLAIVLVSLISQSCGKSTLEECRAQFLSTSRAVSDPDRQFDGKFSQQVLIN